MTLPTPRYKIERVLEMHRQGLKQSEIADELNLSQPTVSSLLKKWINKGKVGEWLEFSKLVESHISQYCIRQYGDYPDEMIEGWGLKEIQDNLDRYVKRIGKGARGTLEEKRDALKIAHYGCLLHAKLERMSRVEQ